MARLDDVWSTRRVNGPLVPWGCMDSAGSVCGQAGWCVEYM